MKLYYDFHIHTALSPCGDDDMTPNNIVNMALLKGLDAIAITDHNSAKNVAACMKCAKGTGLTVIPGMEIETSEEVHMLALFDSYEAASELDSIMESKMPPIKNRAEIFGEQIILDENDNRTGVLDNLLITASMLDVNGAAELVRSLGGVIIPAHIDKDSYSIVSNLGLIPEELCFSAVEIKDPSKINCISLTNRIDKYLLLHNSDAHFLWDIHEKEFFINTEENELRQIITILRNGIEK